jgi:hypothetical protein
MCKLCMTMGLLQLQWSVDCGSQKHDLFFCGVCVHKRPTMGARLVIWLSVEVFVGMVPCIFN